MRPPFIFTSSIAILMKYTIRFAFTLLVSLFFFYSKANIHFSVLFADNMVLQRDKPCAIWGMADKGEKIMLSFNNNTYKAITDKSGRWKIILPAQAAGGPYDIVCKGANSITLHNVLFGDVWVCGGQSNMQFHVSELAQKEAQTRDNNSNIRIFTAGIRQDYVPQDTLTGGKWKVATIETIQNFSAVGFFFGRYIQEHTGVPVGLISDNLGGTAVEEWMSNEAVHSFPQFDGYYNLYLAPGKSFQQINNGFEQHEAEWYPQYYSNDDPGLQQQWYKTSTDTSDWKPMMLPAYWEDAGLPGYDGSVWFKKTFDLPADYKHNGYHIVLGEIDDANAVWVNGSKIGEHYGNLNLNEYNVPDSVLKPDHNDITVRVFDAGNKGGLYNFYWYSAFSGRWLYKPGSQLKTTHITKPLVVNTDTYGSPAILYNANIAPLTGLSIKGVIWYQGEANAQRADEYKQLFPAMIQDWRRQFRQSDLPFLFVQLANWRAEDETPVNSDWAELREAQASALSLSNTGIASAIDIGEANDIHPKNKMEVGRRLALAAMKTVYGQDSTHTHPLYAGMKMVNDSIVIRTSDTILSNDKYGYLKGFAIAGKDSVFHWAQAYVRNNEVVLYSRDVSQPVAVRYAWSNNPGELNLYNRQGLPLLPFRTDNWKGTTNGKKFTYTE